MTENKSNMGIFGGLSEVKMNELRKLLLGLDNEDLKRLTLLINDPEAFSEEISELLPNSIKIMLEKDNLSYAALIPILESVLHDSIKNNPDSIANILFPIIIPAIRKAVSEDIKNMIDSLNSTLGNGFSPTRIGWRFKALFSGKKYAEIVLSKAYIFRVKQVFLIHKNTGLLLNSISDENTVTKDADMISSMLSAIKDFVQDSFDVEKTNVLDTIKVGQFNIWIEQGPSAIIAAIVEGDAHSGLRNVLKESIEKIHLKQSYQLEKFEGDTDIFKQTDPYLQNCLVSEQKEKKKKKPFILVFLLIIILAALGYWSFNFVDKTIRINKLESDLKKEAGIVITDDNKKDGKIIFEGLMDPLAKNPVSIAKKHKFSNEEVIFALKPFISLADELILKRAYNILQPSKNTILKFNDGTLFASGEAEESWVKLAQKKYTSISGINNFDKTALFSLTNKTQVERRILSIENYYFVFKYKTVELNNDQKIKFNNLIDEVNTVLDFNFSQDSVPVIVVLAHTSYDGNAEANENVAFDRAQQFINLMIDAGLPMEVLVPKTDFVEDIQENFPVRSVSFKVIYSKPEDL
jgi:OOP family OmpA-OmpF porin